MKGHLTPCARPGCPHVGFGDYCHRHRPAPPEAPEAPAVLRARAAELEAALTAQKRLAAQCQTDTGKAVAVAFYLSTAAQLRATRAELERAGKEASLVGHG